MFFVNLILKSRTLFVGMLVIVMSLISFSPSVLAVSCFPPNSFSVSSPFTIFGDFSDQGGLIPRSCSLDANNKPKPISPGEIPAIGLRVFNFVVGLIFYFAFAVTVFSGLQYAYGGLDGKQSVQAITNLRDSAFAIILVLSTYIIINTVMINVFGPGGSGLINTDISTFFTGI